MTSLARRGRWLGLVFITVAVVLVVSCSGDRGAVVAGDDPDASLPSPTGPGLHGGSADTSRSVVQHVTRVELAQAASSPPFRDLPVSNGPNDEDEEAGHEPLRPPRHGGSGISPLERRVDPLVQSTVPNVSMPVASHNFHGQGTTIGGKCSAGNCSTPPDANGAVGPSNYVQTTNISGNEGLAIWDKAGNLLSGPKHVNTLWSTLGATDPCRAHNDGDPVVVYDQLADRWFITQFALPNTGTDAGPSFQCVAVSQTNDPTGAYWLYEFSYPFAIDDYGKFGIWPDAYYATFNQFGASTYKGADFCAYDRNSMLRGAAATQQCFLQTAPSGAVPCGNPPYPAEPFQVFGALPVSLDGVVPPPKGEPGRIVQFDYSQCGPTFNQLDLWSLQVDFTTPGNSKLTGPTVLTVGAFTPTCYANGLTGGTGFANCVPQPGTTVTLDGLDDRVMFRAAYRNFGQYESLVVNHSVVAGNGKGGTTNTGSGVRWYEIQTQPGGASPAVVQQSTYAPSDGNWRWMGSIAQDQAGDLALGFAISSDGAAGAVAFPSIAWTGRINADPTSTMGQGETVIDTGSTVEGDAYTASGGKPDEHRGRWGDYSNMTVDPTDDCTFWYTQELYDVTGVTGPIGNWDTYIASAKFPNCAQNDFTISVTPATQNAVPGGTATYTVKTTKAAGSAETIALYVQNLPAGVTLGSFAPASIAAGGSATLTLDVAAGAALTGSPAPSFMVIGKAISAVHAATAQIGVVSCGAAGQLCCAGNTCTAPNTCGGSGTPGVCGCASNNTCTSGAKCGTGIDNCGNAISCGTCAAPQTCGGSGTPGVCGCTSTNTCTGGAKCGTGTDNCGNTISCGTCTAPQTCGGGGTAGVCGCTSNNTCAGGLDCGTGVDNCGNTISCGTCTAPHTCGGGGTAGVCGCTSNNTCVGGLDCGTGLDNCGNTISCGTCVAPHTCGGGGTPGVCGLGGNDAGAGDAGAGDAGGGNDAGADAGKDAGSDAGAKDGGGGHDAGASDAASDAAVTQDGGSVQPHDDASVDGSTGDTGTGSSGGCGCRTAGARDDSSRLALGGFGAIAMVGVIRLRRRRSR